MYVQKCGEESDEFTDGGLGAYVLEGHGDGGEEEYSLRWYGGLMYDEE